MFTLVAYKEQELVNGGQGFGTKPETPGRAAEIKANGDKLVSTVNKAGKGIVSGAGAAVAVAGAMTSSPAVATVGAVVAVGAMLFN